jgi:uncharacterized NAD(P)/FAD-binding protein YdhS
MQSLPTTRRSAATVPKVAVIGAGFTGTLLAVHLLQNARAPLTVHLFDQHGLFGRGVAYATGNPSHLLNVRVANMSALPNDPAHFLLWLWRFDYQVDGLPIPPSGHAFVPRGVYGSYLEDTLIAARKAAAPGVEFEPKAKEVIGLRRYGERYELSFADTAAAAYEGVALCIGNLPPSLPCAVEGQPDPLRLITDPWHEPALAEIPGDAAVVIVGTGLTAVDAVLSLLDQEHSGPITALSRRGLMPSVHAQTRPYRDFLAGEPAPTTVLELYMRLRREVRAAAVARYDWRSVIDAFRPYTERCWQALSQAERRRFLRHARAYWEVHRHRMAPAVAERLRNALDRKQLEIRKGRLLKIVDDGSDLIVSFRSPADPNVVQLRAAHVINSSGPQTDAGGLRHPLVASLLQRGLARPEPLGLGLEVTSDFRLVGADGDAASSLVALGPIARGGCWESTAVPELRVQCARVGKALARHFATRTGVRA